MANNASITNATIVNGSFSAEQGVRDNVLGGTLLTINIFIVMLNSLAVLVIMRFRTKNCIDILVLGLAMTDLTKGLVPVPMSVCTYLTSWFMKTGTIPCDFFGWIAFTTNSASMLILTMMAIERFVAIVRPFAYRSSITKKRMEITVFVAVIFSAFISLLPVLGFGHMKAYNNGAYCHFNYTDKSTESKIYSIFILFYGFLMTFVVLAAYSIVFYKIRDLIKRHKRFAISRTISTSSGKRKKSGEINLKVEKMFSYLTLGLMLLFWFSWFPFLAVLLLNLVKALPLSHDKVDLFAMRVAVVNSMLNPIACASFCKPYRRGFFYYYRKLLSYAGFARPDSDVFDPWRQKSQNTRDQTPMGSFAAPAETKPTRAAPEFHSHYDSGFISDSYSRGGRIPSVLEPILVLDCLPILEDESMESGQKSEDGRLLEEQVNVHPVFVQSEMKSPDDDFADAGCAITEWKQNRQCGEGMVNSPEEKEPTKAIEFNAKEFQETSENIQKEKIWKTKRYSVPILNYCVSSEKKPRPKSLEGFTKKYGKFRPWSLALNESFQRCLNENAFDSAVKLTGFSIAKITDGSLLQGGRTLEDIPNLKGDGNNTWNDECKKVIRSDKVFATDNLQERSVEQQKLSKAKTFNDWSVTGSKYLLELKETGNYLPKDAIIKRRMFAKARSKSAPTSSSDRKEKAILYSSLRDDLDKSLLQMDLLAKGLLTFSSSKLGNTTN